MSSILDALSKVDQANPDHVPVLPLPPPLPPRRRSPWWALAGVVAAGAVGWVALRPDPPPPAPAPVEAPVAVVAPPSTVVAVPATPPSTGLPVVAAVTPPESAAAERPWIRTAPPPSPPTTVPLPPVEPTPIATPPTLPLAPVVTPNPPRGVFVAPKPAAIAPATALPEPAPGTEDLAGVHISFLAYSRNPKLRTVSLTVFDSVLITLREGERAGELQVVRIYPDRVDVLRGGAPFTVRAGR